MSEIGFDLLCPHIFKIIKENGCQSTIDGFIPSIIVKGALVHIDVRKIIAFADNDDYSSITKYIEDLCST